jgi:hypothetical protein
VKNKNKDEKDAQIEDKPIEKKQKNQTKGGNPTQTKKS